MKPTITLDNALVYHGSNLDVLPTLDANTVDAIITDPPYELGFMGKTWDSSGIAYNVQLWAECLRVLKPGGHLLAFSSPRTYHRMTVAIEDAGFEIRDMVSWISNKTFPKSLNVSIAIDKQANVMGHRGKQYSYGHNTTGTAEHPNAQATPSHEPITEEAKQWQGWGTALKPSVEPIVLARKPLEGTVATNVLTYGTGALNIDASRIGNETITINTFDNGAKPFGNASGEPYTSKTTQGRWPANVILDETTNQTLDEQTQRFFYVPRATNQDRNEGLDALPKQIARKYAQDATTLATMPFGKEPVQNFHPTVKPTQLMTYLIQLVTQPGGTVLDPFTGSGTTGKAALLNGYNFIGIELTADYLPIIEARLNHANQTHQTNPNNPTLF